MLDLTSQPNTPPANRKHENGSQKTFSISSGGLRFETPKPAEVPVQTAQADAENDQANREVEPNQAA